jgi:hypothetical protein
MSMRLTRRFVLPIAIISICLAWTGAACAATVTVDVTAKTATGDSTAIEASRPRVRGEQVGVLVKSTVIEPQSVTVKFTGLKDDDYDVYVNQEFKGAKPARELETGVQYHIEGRVADPTLIRCLAALKDPIKKLNDKLQGASSSEAKRVCGTLSQASDWVVSGLGTDQAWRSVAVVVAPAGKALDKMTWQTREDEYGTARALTAACWLLQKARDRMYDAITDPVLRNDTVVALTPVDFSATYSTSNGKPHIDARVTNNCNLPVSGDVTFALPSGWKTNAKSLKFAELKSGQAFSASFDLIAPAKTAAPDTVPVAANVTVTQEGYTASLKLKVVAARQAPAAANK